MTIKESDHDKIGKICDLLKREALEPAETASRDIVSKAEREAEEIIKNAEKNAEEILKNAMARLEAEKGAAHIALKEAHKQALEALRQDIEKKLFLPALHEAIIRESNETSSLSHLINALAEGVLKEGMSSDFSAIVSKQVNASELNKELLAHVLEKLEGQGVQVGPIEGGVLLKLRDKKITLDISDQALLELLSRHLRKDFRDKIFAKVS